MQDKLVFHPPRPVLWLVSGLVVLGGMTFVTGLIWEPQRAWANVLLVSNYLLGLALGGLLLVALHYVTGARWSVPLRRLPEALAVVLPVAGIGLMAVLIFQPSLYSWFAGNPSEEPAPSALRSFWLRRPFFLLRALVYLAVWLTFAAAILRNSRRQDRTGAPVLYGQNARLSAGFLVAFGVTCWLSSYDWLMSLEPNWVSSVFGVYNFAGLFLSALAAVTLLAVWLRRVSLLGSFLTEDHLHDLGTLVFGFSSFWMYTWFCQYMLIWYTNHPEEAVYFLRRSDRGWPALLILDLVLNWALPFAVLLFRPAKRSPGILAGVCIVILAGRWVDLFLIIFPSQGYALAIPGLAEAGFALGAAGIFALIVFRALAAVSLVPVGDPFLVRETAQR